MFPKFYRFSATFLESDEAATAVEYAILLAVIIIFAISGIMGTGDAQKAIWQDTSDALIVIEDKF